MEHYDRRVPSYPPGEAQIEARVILASNLPPQSLGKSDANLFTETVIKMLEEHPELTEGLRAAVYDMALRSTDIDKLQDHGSSPNVTRIHAPSPRLG